MLEERIPIKTSLPRSEVEKLKSWARRQDTTVTAIIRQLIRYGDFIESVEQSEDRRLLLEEADGRMYEIRFVDPPDTKTDAVSSPTKS